MFHILHVATVMK